MTLMVKMADIVNFFKNLLQTHQSEGYKIWVATLGQGKDVKIVEVMPIT